MSFINPQQQNHHQMTSRKQKPKYKVSLKKKQNNVCVVEMVGWKDGRERDFPLRIIFDTFFLLFFLGRHRCLFVSTELSVLLSQKFSHHHQENWKIYVTSSSTSWWSKLECPSFCWFSCCVVYIWNENWKKKFPFQNEIWMKN